MGYIAYLAGVMTLPAILLMSIYIANWREARYRKKFNEQKVTDQEERDEEVREIIYNTQKQFLRFDKFGFTENSGKFKIAVKDMVENIAKVYNPESKTPLYEITLEEMLFLNERCSEIIRENLEGKFSPVKKIKISHLMWAKDSYDYVKEKVDIYDEQIDITSNGKKAYKVFKTIKMALNPIGVAVSNVVTDVTVFAITETVFKVGGKIAIEQIGKEANRTYGGYNSREKIDK